MRCDQVQESSLSCRKTLEYSQSGSTTISGQGYVFGLVSETNMFDTESLLEYQDWELVLEAITHRVASITVMIHDICTPDIFHVFTRTKWDGRGFSSGAGVDVAEIMS